MPDNIRDKPLLDSWQKQSHWFYLLNPNIELNSTKFFGGRKSPFYQD